MRLGDMISMLIDKFKISEKKLNGVHQAIKISKIKLDKKKEDDKDNEKSDNN